MAKAKVKEVQEQYRNSTALELTNEVERYSEMKKQDFDNLQDYAKKAAALDITDPKLVRQLKDLTENMKMCASDIEWADSVIAVLKPMLEAAKTKEDADQSLKVYMQTHREALKPLVEAVERLKAEAIADKKWLEQVDGDVDIIIGYHDYSLQQTIHMIRHYVGDITEVVRCDYNAGRGFDGTFKGTKATVKINTILAWGEIIRPHYRTLVHRM